MRYVTFFVFLALWFLWPDTSFGVSLAKAKRWLNNVSGTYDVYTEAWWNIGQTNWAAPQLVSLRGTVAVRTRAMSGLDVSDWLLSSPTPGDLAPWFVEAAVAELDSPLAEHGKLALTMGLFRRHHLRHPGFLKKLGELFLKGSTPNELKALALETASALLESDPSLLEFFPADEVLEEVATLTARTHSPDYLEPFRQRLRRSISRRWTRRFPSVMAMTTRLSDSAVPSAEGCGPGLAQVPLIRLAQ